MQLQGGADERVGVPGEERPLPGLRTGTRNADVVCRNTSHPETHSEIHLAKGTQQIRIAPGCQAYFAEHLATSDYSIRLDSEIVHFEWDWDPLAIFPAEEIKEMAETLKNLSALNLQKPTWPNSGTSPKLRRPSTTPSLVSTNWILASAT
jgi:hypothetical protein